MTRQQMVETAIARGQVVYTTDQRAQLVTLTAWEPRRRNASRRRGVARIEFPSGARATVPTSTIGLPSCR